MSSVVSHVLGKVAEPNVSGVVFSDVEPDDISVAGVGYFGKLFTYACAWA